METKQPESEISEEETQKIVKETFGDFEAFLKKLENVFSQSREDTTSKV